VGCSGRLVVARQGMSRTLADYGSGLATGSDRAARTIRANSGRSLRTAAGISTRRFFACLGRQSLNGLAGQVGDEFEVFVHVQHGQAGEFGGGGDDQVGNGRCAVLPFAGECHLNV
jgi:hypothetical protein